MDEILAAGAVVPGRRTAEQVDHWGGVHHGDGVLPSRVTLEIVRVIDTPEATHIRYRVRR